MTTAEIEAELMQLNAQIAAQPEPRHYAEALQRRQALSRRTLLLAALRAKGEN
jgi:hypothetical protein